MEPCREDHNLDMLPEFFKIYIPSICSQQLRIPPAIVKCLGRDIPKACILEDPTGKSWKVVLEKIDTNVFFKGGWPEFVRDNSIVYGDFLTFCYADKSKVYVKIYGKNGCKKKYASSSKTDEAQVSEADKGTSQSNTKTSQSSEYKLRPRIPQAVEKADEALKVHSYFTGRTYFRVTLSATSISKGVLIIPSVFHKSNIDKGLTKATLQVGGKTWKVRITNHNVRCYMGKGWQIFVKDNALEEENVCSFKLIDRKKAIFEVTIRR